MNERDLKDFEEGAREHELARNFFNAAHAGDKTAFTRILGEIEANNKLPPNLPSIVQQLALRDAGDMLAPLMELAYDIEEKYLEMQREAVGIKQRTKPVFLNLAHCMEFAGIGEESAGLKPNEIRPAIVDTIIASKQFQKALTDDSKIVVLALSSLLQLDTPQDQRIATLLALAEAKASGVSKTLAKEALIKSLELSSFRHGRHIFNSGADSHFTAMVDRLGEQDANEVLGALACKNLRDDSEIFKKRFSAIVEKASDQGKKNALKNATSSGSRFMVAVLSQGSAENNKEALLAACGPNTGGATAAQGKLSSLHNLKELLKGDFEADDISEAIQAAINAKKDAHLVALVDYAVAKKIADASISKPTPDGSTLLIKALSIKNSRNQYDETDNPVAERMALKLMQHMNMDSVLMTDNDGASAMSILAQRKMEHSAAYSGIRRIMENKIDIGFIQQRVAAEFAGKVEAVRSLLGRGVSENIILALLGGGHNNTQQSAPAAAQLPPAPGPHSTKVSENRTLPDGPAIPPR